jgi:hypothetical protein
VRKNPLHFAILILSGLLVTEGISLLFFEKISYEAGNLQRSSSKLPPGSTKGRVPEIQEQLSILRYLSIVPGVRSWAREVTFGLLNATVSQGESLEKQCVEILKAQPGSGMRWFELARLHVLRFGLDQKAQTALELSEATDPREIEVMARRLTLYLPNYNDLAEERKRRVINEVVAIGPLHAFLSDEAVREIKLTAQNQSDELRGAIRQKLNVEKLDQRPWLKAVGF